LDSLSQHAYGIYFVHYVFVIWLQYILLNARACHCKGGIRIHRCARLELGRYRRRVPQLDRARLIGGHRPLRATSSVVANGRFSELGISKVDSAP
jgi:hypothetical protein